MIRQFVRYQSTIPKLRRRATFKEVLRSPATKSLFLTIVFGSIVTEVISRRNKLETLRDDHKIKMGILHDIRLRLEKGETIDLQKEIQLASKVSEVDIDVDQALNEFLRLASDEPKGNDDYTSDTPISSSQPVTEGTSSKGKDAVSTKGYI